MNGLPSPERITGSIPPKRLPHPSSGIRRPEWIPATRFRGHKLRGNDGQTATASVNVTCLAEMTSFPRKRESIVTTYSRNLSICSGSQSAMSGHSMTTASAMISSPMNGITPAYMCLSRISGGEMPRR